MQNVCNIRKKWVVYPIQVLVSGQILSKLDIKLPGNVLRCTGVLFTNDKPTIAGVNDLLGTISLHFNARQTHPLHLHVLAAPLIPERKIVPLKMDEACDTGMPVQGYYQDLGNAVSYPYNIKVYLETLVNG